MADQIKSYWDVLEQNLDAINIYEGPEKYFESCAKASRLVVILYATHMCASEVRNGGFLQLFWNNTGIAVPEAIEGYRAIALPELAGLVESAAGLLGQIYPRGREDRWAALLSASGRESEELKKIFDRNSNLYGAFVEATEPINWDPRDEQFWDFAANEGGGYDKAATRYARSLKS